MKKKEGKRTIQDFGNQWLIHGSLAEDYWTSDEMFRDHFENQTPPFFDLRDRVVVDIGSGSGRVLKMLSRYQPKRLIGVEPSHGFEVLRNNTREIANLELVNLPAEKFVLSNKANVAVSLGVIHHIPNPIDAVKNIYNQLSENGTFIMWVYGFENNRSYVFFQQFFRKFFRLAPDLVLDRISLAITYLLDTYLFVSKSLCHSRLPLTIYLDKLFSKCGRLQKKYIVFDQLNPVYAKYYKKSEVIKLLTEAGFSSIELFHRHSYSWTAIARK
jgi:SAM-dependent methyltransferase